MGIVSQLKQFSQMIFQPYARRYPIGGTIVNNSRRDYSRTRMDAANIVMAPIQWGMRQFIEAPPVVEIDGTLDSGHDAVRLIRKPNGFYTGNHLLMVSLMSLWIDGNSYWIIVRDERTDEPIQLWFVPPWLLEPVSETAETFIEYYRYTPLGKEFPIEPRDVVHVRYGLDPHNMRKGLGPVKTAVREVYSDEEASNFSASILTNQGMPGVLIMPDTDRVIPQKDVDDVSDYFKNRMRGDSRGEPFVMGMRARVEQFGWEPSKIDLRAIREIPEERVAALLGIPAAVIGFGSGLAQTKVGAPQPVSAKLWTPTGEIAMGDVVEGQVIATPNGWKPVEAVYPQGEQDIYRVTFQDGSTAESTLNHLWNVHTPNNGWQTLTLEDVAKFSPSKLKRAAVPEQGVVEFDERKMLISPYLLGVMIADGTFCGNMTVSNLNYEIIERVWKELPEDYALTHTGEGDYRIGHQKRMSNGKGGGSGRMSPMVAELRRLGLWMKKSNEKFIPDEYKYNSAEVRRDVLRGIMDGDGWVHRTGQPIIEQSSERLADDVTWLVQSLGGYTKRSAKRANTSERLIAGRPFRSRHDRTMLYLVMPDATDAFWCSEKREKARKKAKTCRRRFRSIEYVRREEAQCIKIDGSLYLTDNFIATHNTMTEMRRLAYENAIIPTQAMFREEWGEKILPEFETNEDAELTFDISNVRVLQEDEGKKIERLSMAVKDGWLPVSVAQGLAGYPVDETQAVYLRRAMNTESPAQIETASAAVTRREKAAVRVRAKREPSEQGVAFYELQGRAGEELTAMYEGELAERFGEMADGVAREFETRAGERMLHSGNGSARKQDEDLQMVAEAAVESVFSRKNNREVLGKADHYVRTARRTIASYNEAYRQGAEMSADLETALTSVARNRDHLPDLKAQTKGAVTRAIRAGREAGEGIFDISERIKDKVGAGPWKTKEYRAHIIARTETRYAQNISSVELGKLQGAPYFEVLDARLGPTDSYCMSIDGEIVTANDAEYLSWSEHPNGTRAFAPIFDAEAVPATIRPETEDRDRDAVAHRG